MGREQPIIVITVRDDLCSFGIAFSQDPSILKSIQVLIVKNIY